MAWEAKRAVPLWTDGTNTLPTCHVEDLARTAAAVATQRPTAQYHVVADAVPVTLQEATSAIANVFAQEVRTTSPLPRCRAEVLQVFRVVAWPVRLH